MEKKKVTYEVGDYGFETYEEVKPEEAQAKAESKPEAKDEKPAKKEAD